MIGEHSRYGPLAGPAADAGHRDHPPRMGFFTDTSVCIGCKACEVACKEWNGVPEDGLNLLGMSFDNTGMLGADSWRHVAFVEQDRPLGHADAGLDGLPTGVSATETLQQAVASALRETERGGGDLGTAPADLELPASQLPGRRPGQHGRGEFRWLMASDVCKHCTHAGCLDVCPTGALFRTEFGTVVVQPDICNGCGYCVSGCPYGVIDRRKDDGRAWKCTLCYDRLRGGLEPACAKACPTNSIQYGPLDELRERAGRRLEEMHAAGVAEARLYGGAVPARRQRTAALRHVRGRRGLRQGPEVHGAPAARAPRPPSGRRLLTRRSHQSRTGSCFTWQVPGCRPGLPGRRARAARWRAAPPAGLTIAGCRR